MGNVNAAPPAVAEPVATEQPTKKETLAERYCAVVVNAAVAAKLKEEEAKANAVKADIEVKLEQLKKATADLKTWLERREEFKSKATDNLVTVYMQMDPEAAAQRLTLVGEPAAAAIIMKLPPKSASAILGEMQPEMAGKITAFMAGAAAVKPASDGRAGATQ
jgi:flagellar motility protein MotE (MotC chaperone)